MATAYQPRAVDSTNTQPVSHSPTVPHTLQLLITLQYSALLFKRWIFHEHHKLDWFSKKIPRKFFGDGWRGGFYMQSSGFPAVKPWVLLNANLGVLTLYPYHLPMWPISKNYGSGTGLDLMPGSPGFNSAVKIQKKQNPTSQCFPNHLRQKSPASISTSYFDPWPVPGTQHVCETWLQPWFYRMHQTNSLTAMKAANTRTGDENTQHWYCKLRHRTSTTTSTSNYK